MKKLLFVGDFACTTGFARVLESLAINLSKRYQIDVLAINYFGDPSPLQKKFNIFPAALSGDVHGLRRIANVVASGKYDLVFMLNDIWIIIQYLEQLKRVENAPPVVFYTPVDARHIKQVFAKPLNDATHGIFYTEFGAQEVLKAGFEKPHSVIPHGVDTDLFYFTPINFARKETGIPEDWYVTLMLDRNQPRKRLDLGVYYFAEWVKRTNKPREVKLYYHGALQDLGYDIEDLALEWGVDDRLIVTHKQMTMHNMLSVEKLRLVYSSANVFWKPCASEGWGLSLHEAMACGVPAIVPRSSALAEWPNGGVEYVDVHTDIPEVNPGGVNTIQDIPTLDSFIEKAELLYNDAQHRKQLGMKGYSLATQDIYNWKNIADRFASVFEGVMK